MGLIKKAAAGGSSVKSIQHVTVSNVHQETGGVNRLTIEPVNVEKSIVTIKARSDQNNSQLMQATAEITSPTQVTVTWGWDDMRTEYYNISIEVIEFDESVTVQKVKGDAGNTSNPFTLPQPIDPNKTMVTHLKLCRSSYNSNLKYQMFNYTLTNTTLTVLQISTFSRVIVAYLVTYP